MRRHKRGAVLLVGAVAMIRKPERARTIGLTGPGFAILGFLVGLNMTARGGHRSDVAYHVIAAAARRQ